MICRRSKSKRGNENFSTNISESGIPPPPELPPNEKAPWINIPSSQFAQDWSKMVNNQNHSDVTFRLDTKTYHAHRYILCSASEVFRRVFDVEAGGSAKVKVQSLAECPGWNSRRLKKVTAANINSGLVEGFISIQDKWVQLKLIQNNDHCWPLQCSTMSCSKVQRSPLNFPKSYYHIKIGTNYPLFGYLQQLECIAHCIMLQPLLME